VADWWLGRTRALLEEREAAAAPAKTTDMAKMRIASFIVGYPLEMNCQEMSLLHTGIVDN
jgi:hypothetical protein